MSSTTDSFFEEQTPASRVKSAIVSKYFSGWANVMCSQRCAKIAYVDLFSGRGRYKDGSPSTPILLVTKAVQNHKLRTRIQFVFNDANPDYVETLKKELEAIPSIDSLRYQPVFYTNTVDQNTVRSLEEISTVPTLSFVDPCGYRGLSLSLIRALVKDWGCDSIFFFNYRRINPGIENKRLQKPISLVFADRLIKKLRTELQGKTPGERECIILKEVEQVFRKWGMKFVLPFPFKSPSGQRTTHHLIFVSKNVLGYTIMKGIMAGTSSSSFQGVPSFEYNPDASNDYLFPPFTPLDDLKKDLLTYFAGKTLTRQEVFEIHQIGRIYIEKNYRDALLDLEKSSQVETNRSTRTPRPRSGSFPKDMIVTFPPQQEDSQNDN